MISGQARAVDDGGREPNCGGGGTIATITRTLSVTSPGQGVITDDGGGINCGNGNGDCTQLYSFIRTCDDFGTCEDSGIDTAILTASGGPSGYSPNWTGCSSVTNNQCTVVMDVSRTVSVSWVDVTNPTVTLTSPANGAEVGASIQAAASASDNAGVTVK